MTEGLPYAAVLVHFLDRETGKVTKKMFYPVTQIELYQWDGTTAEVVHVRTLRVDPNDAWVEPGCWIAPSC